MTTKEDKKKLFGQILLEKRLVSEDQIKEALEIQEINGKTLGDVLVDLEYTTSNRIIEGLSDYLGMEVVDLENVDLNQDVLDKIPHSVAQLYRIIPIDFNESTITVAQQDPLDIQQMDDLRFLLKYNVKPVLVERENVANAIDKYYPGGHESVEEILDKFQHDLSATNDSKSREIIEMDHLKEMSNETPIKSFVNLILLQAVVVKASDIHFEVFENEFRVRYRIDGVLREKVPVPVLFANGIISRIKVMANMDIAERRLPQDGRVFLNIREHAVDIRISTLPTNHGESVVMRILDKSSVSLDLTRLGMMPDNLKTVKQLMHKPNGIILVTGPTGSGKTTTLYACLNHINITGLKIITTEDPVEYDIDGIMQIQINPEIDVTFANCLRSILRQDPDIILIGEIRDLETLEIAVQASLTGHLVLSTLHTNDAPSTITRLINMGLKPYLITAALVAIISQRLVKKICPDCKEEYAPDNEILQELKLLNHDLQDKRFYMGKGCSSCNRTGYKGRMSILEIMSVNEEMCSHIIKHSSTETIREIARNNGMKTLSESGLSAVYDGLTTLEEVARETSVN
ncbi:MAG: Flp pilus assembly complex ATPase component [Candidatus Scalindua sp.]|nr:Flp pilus assembly complex ATPase component [Candidatus Scalindua sp.]